MTGLSGLFAPLPTPFTDDGGSVSEVRAARLVRHMIEHGAEGFLLCTDTGEFTTINTGERKQLLEIAMREAHGMPVIVNCTRLGTAQAMDLCQHAARHGARAAVVMPPYFGNYDDSEIEQHLRRIIQHAGLPVIVVDPFHRLTPAMSERLEGMQDFLHAGSLESASQRRLATEPPGLATDEFALEQAVASPLILIDPKGCRQTDWAPVELAALVARYGRARTAKAALALRDIEVGPPRSPALPLPHEASVQLARLIQTG